MQFRCFGKAFFLLGLAVGLSSCGGSSGEKPSQTGDGPNVTLTGTLATGFSLNGRSLGDFRLAANTVEVNQIWAIPIEGVSLRPHSLQDRIVLDIASDGSFSFNPAQHQGTADHDFLFAMVNKEACELAYEPGSSSEVEHDARRACIVGYVTLPAFEDNLKSLNSEGNLTAFPFSKMTANVDLGELNRIENVNSDSYGDGQSESSLEEQELNFSLDLVALRSIAKTDGILKYMKNIFANSNNAFDNMVVQNVAYKWFLTDSEKSAGLEQIKNSFASPTADGSSFPMFIGFHTYIRTGVNVNAYSQADEGSGELIKIAPPGQVTTCSVSSGECGLTSFSPASPYVAKWPVTAVDGDAMQATIDSDLPGFSYSIDPENKVFGAITEMIGGVSPPGYWTIHMNPSKQGAINDSHFLGKFDMSLAEPFSVNSEGVRDVEKPIIFYPSVKATVENDLVSQVDVKFYSLVDGSFVEVPGEVALSLVSSPAIFFEGTQSCDLSDDERNFRLSPDEMSFVISSDKTFGFPGTGAGDCQIGNIAVSYHISGLDFMFHW